MEFEWLPSFYTSLPDGAEIKLERLIISRHLRQRPTGFHQGCAAIKRAGSISLIVQLGVQPLEGQGAEGRRGVGTAQHYADQSLPLIWRHLFPGGVAAVLEGISQPVVVPLMD